MSSRCILVPSNAGNISMRLSTKYTVVHRTLASTSSGVSGRTKCVTSAISAARYCQGERVHKKATIDTLQPNVKKDTNSDLKVAIGKRSNMQGIIDIRASRRIDATNGIRCQITTSLTILLGDGPWHGG